MSRLLAMAAALVSAATLMHPRSGPGGPAVDPGSGGSADGGAGGGTDTGGGGGASTTTGAGGNVAVDAGTDSGSGDGGAAAGAGGSPSQGSPDDGEGEGPAGAAILDALSSGSGCAIGSATVTISPDHGKIVLEIPPMIAQHPPGPATQNLHCGVSIVVRVSDGWQFAVSDMNMSGHAHLPSGTWAQVATSQLFPGFGQASKVLRSRMDGPFDDVYSLQQVSAQGSEMWSPCGGSVVLMLDTTVVLHAEHNLNEDALVATDSINGMFKRSFGWKWRLCGEDLGDGEE